MDWIGATKSRSVHLKLGQNFFQAPVWDPFYAQTKYMLANLGLQNYEKNFKKGLLTGNTVPLLTDSWEGTLFDFSPS